MLRNDVFKTKELQYLSLFAASFDESAHVATSLKEILKRATVQGNGVTILPVVYEPSTYRLHVTKGMSLQQLPKTVRNALLPEGVVDIDVVNSAPTILANVCHMHNVNCLYLDQFVSHYQEMMQELASCCTNVKTHEECPVVW